MVEDKEFLIEYHGLLLVDSSTWFDKYAWCWVQFGPISTRWFVKDSYIYFRNEEDVTWYLLKWGE